MRGRIVGGWAQRPGGSVGIRLLEDVPRYLNTALLLRLLCEIAAIVLVTIAVLPFRWIERVFGLLGLMLLVFIAVAWKLEPQWTGIARGLLPLLATAVVLTGTIGSYLFALWIEVLPTAREQLVVFVSVGLVVGLAGTVLDLESETRHLLLASVSTLCLLVLAPAFAAGPELSKEMSTN